MPCLRQLDMGSFYPDPATMRLLFDGIPGLVVKWGWSSAWRCWQDYAREYPAAARQYMEPPTELPAEVGIPVLQVY